MSNIKNFSYDNMKKIISILAGVTVKTDEIASQCVLPWNSETTYNYPQLVIYNNNIYQALEMNQNQEPNDDSIYWEDLTGNMEEFTAEEIEEMLGFSKEDIEYLNTLIADDMVSTTHTYSSSKIYESIQEAIEKCEDFTLKEMAKKVSGSYKIAADLSEITSPDFIYLINNESVYDLYVLIDEVPTKIGDTNISLDNYYTKTEIDDAFLTIADADGKFATIEALDAISGATGLDAKADKVDTVLENSLSMGRVEGSVIGENSVAIGTDVTAAGNHSSAKGYRTTALGTYSSVEGCSNEVASSIISDLTSSTSNEDIIAAWNQEDTIKFTLAKGYGGHAEGANTLALGNYSHTEGRRTITTGAYAHAEGNTTLAQGQQSHAEGIQTSALGYTTHAEGYRTTASGEESHIEGLSSNTAADAGYDKTLSNKDIVDLWEAKKFAVTHGKWSHAEGENTLALADGSHTEGVYTIALSKYAHAEGSSTTATGSSSHSEGFYSEAYGDYSHAGGVGSYRPKSVFTEAGILDKYYDRSLTKTEVLNAFITKPMNISYGKDSFVHGDSNAALGIDSFASGFNNMVWGDQAIAMGTKSSAIGSRAFGVGALATAYGTNSFAQGGSDYRPYLLFTDLGKQEAFLNRTLTVDEILDVWKEKPFLMSFGVNSFAHGGAALALGGRSHAEGARSIARGNDSHAEGEGSVTFGPASHAEGCNTGTYGSYSHAEGVSTRNPIDVIRSITSETTNEEIIAEWVKAETDETTGEKTYLPFNLAKGYASHTEGGNCLALGNQSHAEGYRTLAVGPYAHSQGYATSSLGYGSHSEGYSVNRAAIHIPELSENTPLSDVLPIWKNIKFTMANGYGAHAEGYATLAYANQAHTEGCYTIAAAIQAHAEGLNTFAMGQRSHAEGLSTNRIVDCVDVLTASNNDIFEAWKSNRSSLTKGAASHTEGANTLAFGDYSHAEGSNTLAIGSHSHSEGIQTIAKAEGSHAEGRETVAFGMNSHAEGRNSKALSQCTHAEGNNTSAVGENSHAEGSGTTNGVAKIDERIKNLFATGNGGCLFDADGTTYSLNDEAKYDLVEDWIYNDKFNLAFGTSSHVEGADCLALSDYAHAEGLQTVAQGPSTHTEGYYTQAWQQGAHAEGHRAVAYGHSSHAEGFSTNHAFELNSVPNPALDGHASIADVMNAWNDDKFSMAYGNHSHVEGADALGLGVASHAEGYRAVAKANYSHAEGNKTKVLGEAAHAEGYQTTALGDCSHAEGSSTYMATQDEFILSILPDLNKETSNEDILNAWNAYHVGITHNPGDVGSSGTGSSSEVVYHHFSLAKGNSAHVEGFNCLALDDCAHAEGLDTKALGKYSHTEGQATVARTVCSHAEGYQTTALGQSSHAEGVSTVIASEAVQNLSADTSNEDILSAYTDGNYFNLAKGNYSHSEGSNTLALGLTAHSEGTGTKAIGNYSHAEGYFAVAFGNYTHAEGRETTAKGDYSHAEGYNTTAYVNQHVQGHFNVTSTGSYSGTTGDAFIIGNGTSSASSNACRITYAGAVIGKAAYQASGADYAEFFEWLDGNPDGEDRRGLFVTLDGNKIKLAQADDFVLGVVSANPAVLGNNDMEWTGQFLKDEFGSPIMESVEIVNEETNEVTICETYKLNPEFDETQAYIFREDRPEWEKIGLIGQLVIIDDGTCEVNGYCKVGENGKGTKGEFAFNTYRVMERIADNLIKIVLK